MKAPLTNAQLDQMVRRLFGQEKPPFDESFHETLHVLIEMARDRNRLADLVNSPQVEEFLEAVRTESAHQVERWGEDDRATKGDLDWLWLVTYLGAKVLFGKTEKNADTTIARWLADGVRYHALHLYPKWKSRDGKTKERHRVITIAAAAMNWHRNRWPGKAPA